MVFGINGNEDIGYIIYSRCYTDILSNNMSNAVFYVMISIINLFGHYFDTKDSKQRAMII